MEGKADAMTADLPHHMVTLAAGVIGNGLSHIAQRLPGLDLSQTQLHALLGGFHQIQPFFPDTSDTEHPGAVGIIAVQNGGDIHIDDIPVL